MSECGGEAIRVPREKGGRVGESKAARVTIGVVVVKATQLAPQIKRVISAQIVKRIRKDKGGVRSALRKSSRSAHINSPTADGYLRQADRVGDARLNIEIQRIQFRKRTEENVNAIEAKASFIHNPGIEDMSLVQGEDLTAGLARVTEPGNVVPLQGWLAAKISLKDRESARVSCSS